MDRVSEFYVLAVVVLLAAGGALLWFVNPEEGRRMAARLEG